MTILRTLSLSVIGAIASLLVSCGGDAPKAVSQSQPQPSASSQLVSLPGVATVDMSGHPELVGKTITISSISDQTVKNTQTLRSVLDSHSGIFEATFPDNNVIMIRSDTVPSGNLTVNIYDPSAISTAQGSVVSSIYSIAPIEAVAGEESESELSPIISTSSDSGWITASVPYYEFQEYGDGTFVLYLAVGNANTYSPPAYPQIVPNQSSDGSTIQARAAAHTASSQAGPSFAPSLPCPVNGTYTTPVVPVKIGLHPIENAASSTSPYCIERSRFNPLRFLPGQTSAPHKHDGMDFVASPNTPVYVPAGGTPTIDNSITASQYDQILQSGANSSAGITLDIKYVGYEIRLLHLNSIDPALLLNGGINEAYVTSADVPVAYSGGTGAGLNNPHLHYELYTYSEPVTKVVGGVSSTTYKLAAIDPFPYVASSFYFLEANGKTQLSTGTSYQFAVEAQDMHGVTVSSSVQNPRENRGIAPGANGKGVNFMRVPYDPTRKFCLTSLPSTTINFPNADNVSLYSGVNASLCTPWGKNLSASATADQPSTIIEAKYSNDPSQSAWDDPLSTASATLSLSAPAPILASIHPPVCDFGYDYVQYFSYYAPQQTCGIEFCCAAQVVESILIVSMDPSIVSVSGPVYNPGCNTVEIFNCWEWTFTSGRVAGSTRILVYGLYNGKKYPIYDFVQTNYYSSS